MAAERLGSAGRPAPLVTVAIMDESGALVPDGGRGEIVVRSSLVMAGYYKNPRRRPRRVGSAGITRETSATSMGEAFSTSSTEPRT